MFAYPRKNLTPEKNQHYSCRTARVRGLVGMRGFAGGLKAAWANYTSRTHYKPFAHDAHKHPLFRFY